VLGGGQDLVSTTSLLADMPAGATFGTFVHRVLEKVDFAAPDLQMELLAAVESERAGYPEGTTGDPVRLAKGLEAAISTSLGGLAGAARLRDLSRADRLDELSFELPLAGGDNPLGEVLVADLARLFSSHIQPGQPLARYVDELSGPYLATSLRGYLTGSLDLVFRLRDAVGETFFVADYKTNWLGGPDQELTEWHYRAVALEAEMRRSHYPLQAMLYLVALHRYLRWRMPGYDPAVNLGGAFYLFLRGMACPGPSKAEGGHCGVFAWSPPPGLVTGLSDLLAGNEVGH
jgi:exodeoxyribonuclease V beta subunit